MSEPGGQDRPGGRVSAGTDAATGATYSAGQAVWYTPWHASFEEPRTWAATYVRQDEDGHVVRFPDGRHMTLFDAELSAEPPTP